MVYIGLAKGAEISNISIIGGETASLPEIIDGFDLAGTCLAYGKKDRIITGENIESSDVIIGVTSSGLHSNGYTLARRILDESRFSFEDTFPNNMYPRKTIGEILLTPTKIYVKEILTLCNEINVHGLAHITGGGLKNLLRLKKQVRFVITKPFHPNDIFKFLQELGGIELNEMYQTFNMGLGFAIIVDESDKEKTLKILKKNSKSNVQIIGHIEKGEGVIVPSLDISY